MSSELSGYLATLSGQVAGIQEVQSFLDQQILLRPDLTAFSAYQVAWNTQMDELEALILRAKDDITILQNIIINLNIEVSDTQASLVSTRAMVTGHIPRFATGLSASTHTGGNP